MSHLILLFHRITKQVTSVVAPAPSPPVDTQFLITDLGDFLVTDVGDSLVWA